MQTSAARTAPTPGSASDVPFLGNRKPIDILHTGKGAAAVEWALHNMRHGIYS
ncbi:MAG: DUF2384 domain-containing protein [Rhodobiaceae bacterium]|nr:DUF2384 domain-containing protein [Rhodobiaceae bacterium]